MKSLAAQVDAMRRRWPNFEVTRSFEPSTLIWFGNLIGLERCFRVMIKYGLPFQGRNESFRRMPIVQVIRPSLVPNPYAKEEAPLPHVYFNCDDLSLSALCLFDPQKNEWNHRKLIAYTTVYWTIDWLACYEFWEATGEWTGGGRHAVQEEVFHG